MMWHTIPDGLLAIGKVSKYYKAEVHYYVKERPYHYKPGTFHELVLVATGSPGSRRGDNKWAMGQYPTQRAALAAAQQHEDQRV